MKNKIIMSILCATVITGILKSMDSRGPVMVPRLRLASQDPVQPAHKLLERTRSCELKRDPIDHLPTILALSARKNSSPRQGSPRNEVRPRTSSLSKQQPPELNN